MRKRKKLQEEQQIRKIKKLKRMDLLEILLAQSKRIDELEKELEETKRQLLSKKIKIRKIGTLAEASLQLNAIFEDADAAAKQYLHNIRRLNRIAEKKQESVEKHEENQMESKSVTNDSISGQACKTGKI